MLAARDGSEFFAAESMVSMNTVNRVKGLDEAMKLAG
jgi:hypothetical protein